ncbi:MAG: hypothetical protein ACI9M3_001384, partial [Bacteroidia bacterium]
MNKVRPLTEGKEKTKTKKNIPYNKTGPPPPSPTPKRKGIMKVDLTPEEQKVLCLLIDYRLDALTGREENTAELKFLYTKLKD